MDYNAPLYQYPPEIWDEKKCKSLARHTAKDGLGTPYGFKGYIGSSACRPSTYGIERYNGGFIAPDGEWYQGQFVPFPIIHSDYKIVSVPTWGWRIMRKDDDSDLKCSYCVWRPAA